jgi:hypothetical protein
MSPLPDFPPTEIGRERELTPRGRRASSAGPMVRILFPPLKVERTLEVQLQILRQRDGR